MLHIATAELTALRFMPEDHAILDALQRKLGIVNRTDIMRMALRALAGAQGVDVGGVRRRLARAKS